MPWDPFTGPSIPTDINGDGYPDQFDGLIGIIGGGGSATTTLDTEPTGLPIGNSIDYNVVSGNFYAEFDPYGPSDFRGFAHDYSASPGAWLSNTYTNVSFWINIPPTGAAFQTAGMTNTDVGTYVKPVAGGDTDQDGDHYYHSLNLPNTGTWIKVILNMHPSHYVTDPGYIDPGYLPHPEYETNYNYWDELTRMYITQPYPQSTTPGIYKIADFNFYQQTTPQNDAEIYSLAATVVPQSNNEVILTWDHDRYDAFNPALRCAL